MDEIEARMMAEQRVKMKQGFKIHLLVYFLVNAFLWINNLILDNNQSPISTTVFWGIGVVTHWYVIYVGNKPQKYEDKVEAELKKIMFDKDDE